MKKNSKPNPDAKKREPVFFLPQAFLNQLNEYTNGGYILITMDELGDPVVYSRFDNKTLKVGLQTLAEKFLTKKNKIQESFAVVNDSDEGIDDISLLRQIGHMEDMEDEDDEDGEEGVGT